MFKTTNCMKIYSTKRIETMNRKSKKVKKSLLMKLVWIIRMWIMYVIKLKEIIILILFHLVKVRFHFKIQTTHYEFKYTYAIYVN